VSFFARCFSVQSPSCTEHWIRGVFHSFAAIVSTHDCTTFMVR
jgi:hypothetical protein